MRRGRIIWWLGIGLGAAFVCFQFVRLPLSNPPVTSEIQAPAAVRQVLRRSCYNCHSNETTLSWFDQVVPAYWVVVSDVAAARHHVNFSEMGKLPADEQRTILFEAVNKIQLGAMPLPSYRAVHPHASVTNEELEVLRAYLKSSTLETRLASASPVSVPVSKTRLGQSQAARKIRPAPNGIEFIPDYKNWQTVSSTDRFDNDTVRVVLGNDVAIKAIAADQINPWPDGTILAKVVWSKHVDQTGVARAGKLLHIALMIRDSSKYSKTKNWGYAWWNGEELEPYGKDASFAHECVTCHAPLRKNDYVFTTPIAR